VNPVGILKRPENRGGLCKCCYWRFVGTLQSYTTHSFTNPNIILNQTTDYKSTEINFFPISETTSWPEICIGEYKTMIARLLLRLPNLAAQIVVSYFENVLNSKNLTRFHLMTSKQRHIRRMQHEDEMLSRIKCCLDQKLIPAHDYVHLSKGDDRQFMFGVCPWTKDGAIRKNAVPYARESNLTISKELQVPELMPVSKYIKIEAKNSVKVKKMMKAASGSRKITSYGEV